MLKIRERVKPQAKLDLVLGIKMNLGRQAKNILKGRSTQIGNSLFWNSVNTQGVEGKKKEFGSFQCRYCPD